MLLRWLISAFVLSSVSPAGATSDGGRRGVLLGIAGERHALLVERSVQVACSEVPCRAYVVDLDDRKQPRSRLRLLSNRGDLAEYRAALGDDGAALGAIVPAERLTVLPLRRVDERRDALHIEAPEGLLLLSLEQTGTRDTMSAYEGNSERSCLDSAGVPLCRDCRESSQWIGGYELSFWACTKQPSLWRDDARRKDGCDCHAGGPIYTLRLDGRGPPDFGTQIFAAPYQLAQNLIGGRREAETSIIELTPEAVLAHRSNEGHVVVTGAAVHAPRDNGTYFPVLVSSLMGSPENRGNTTSSDEVALPSGAGRQAGPACRGCAIPRGGSKIALVLLAALLLTIRWRRRSAARQPMS